MKYICPVCNYDGLTEPPYNSRGYGSYEICMCCGFQFGYSDYPNGEKDILEWRKEWIKNGYPWSSKSEKPPLEWQGGNQVNISSPVETYDNGNKLIKQKWYYEDNQPIREIEYTTHDNRFNASELSHEHTWSCSIREQYFLNVKSQRTVIDNVKSGYFTNMKDILIPIKEFVINKNWLITDYECNFYPVKDIVLGKGHAWLEGSKLLDIVIKNEIQFIWGVFSGFEKELDFKQILKQPLPYANGNPNLWTKDNTIQNTLADIEIICWDSTLVLINSPTDKIIHDIQSSNS